MVKADLLLSCPPSVEGGERIAPARTGYEGRDGILVGLLFGG